MYEQNGTHTNNRNARETADVKRSIRNASLEAQKVQRRAGAKFLVRFTSVRKRFLDEDNLCPKYHCDLLRYAGILPSDAPSACKIEVTQRKTTKGEEERVIIEVFKVYP